VFAAISSISLRERLNLSLNPILPTVLLRRISTDPTKIL
jgi:hypothetical protein